MVGGNEWNYININEHEHEEHEEEEEEEKDLSRTALIVKIKSQSKSVMDAGGGTGSNPLSLPPSLSEAKKKSKFGSVHRNTTYLTKREKDSPSCSPSKEKERKNIKNTNTLNMDVACEAIDGLALLYLPPRYRYLWTYIVYPSRGTYS